MGPVISTWVKGTAERLLAVSVEGFSMCVMRNASFFPCKFINKLKP